MNNRDVDVLRHIVCYCAEIEEAKAIFGDSQENLQANNVYKNAVAMCIIQIGELTGHLSDEFKAMYNHLPWRDIKGMRNIATHNYGRLDTQKLYETTVDDIPVLREFCEITISEFTQN